MAAAKGKTAPRAPRKPKDNGEAKYVPDPFPPTPVPEVAEYVPADK